MLACVTPLLQVSLHGGQVLSWKTERGEELLFSSSKVNEVFVSVISEQYLLINLDLRL